MRWTRFFTICGRRLKIFGSALSNPSAKETIIFSAASKTLSITSGLVNSSITVNIKSTNLSIKVGVFLTKKSLISLIASGIKSTIDCIKSGKLSNKLSSKFKAASNNSGAKSSIILGSLGRISSPNFSINVPVVSSACSNIGNKFPAAVTALSAKSFVSLSKSAFLSPIPVIRLSQADFILEIEPCNVLAASFAVVPIDSKASSWVISPFLTFSAASSADKPDICISV